MNNSDCVIQVLTTVYPGSEQFFESFRDDLISQDIDNFQLIMINDGVCEEQLITLFPEAIIRNSRRDIFDNRLELLRLSLNSKGSKVVFCDIDDRFFSNKLKVCSKAMDEFLFGCHDLDLVWRLNEPAITNYFKRCLHNSNVTLPMLLDKNCYGLTNTFCQKKVIADVFPIIQKLSGNTLVFDWILGTLLTKLHGPGKFVSKSLAEYRANSAAHYLYDGNQPTFEKIKKIKVKHLSALEKVWDKDKAVIQKKLKLTRKKQYSINFQKQHQTLWWET